MKKTFVLLLTIHSLLFSQRFSHSLHTGVVQQRVTAADDTLNILAVMVQFQTDTDDRSSGNGQFDLGISATPIIDAPPHDSAYFADHFVFAQNYFRKASNGKQHINATLLGTVITLPKQMKDYAPISGNLPLATMVEEVWKKVDTLNPGFSFASYDLFVVLHAGVGKDVDLRAALGYDPTPYDLPSLYFNLNALKNLFGASFDGIPVQNSGFRIKNSVVLPETEVRKIPSVGGDFTLKLGLNGLLVASIASHLGLPDLFDTETGRTAIGRFGLMDGQSIFSFSGICPPEPSAWEKSFMGWTTPIEVYGNKTLSLPAVSLYESGNDTIYKIPISAKEYFLVENRQRDAKNDSQKVTMKWNGQIISKTFTRDENFYSNSNIDSIYGVVLDVDELDWSLPGLINDNNNYRGGILVWHIDETIVEKNLASNSINADPLKRGVDVEEADGSQDIGQTYDFVSPGSGSEDGSPIDYWFSGNISPVYKNVFSETTNPNSLSNSFAKSHITLKNFSSSSPRMTFEANVGETNIRLLKTIRRSVLKMSETDSPLLLDLNADYFPEILFTHGDSILILKNNFTPFFENTALLTSIGGDFAPSVSFGGITSVGTFVLPTLYGIHDSTVFFFSFRDVNQNGVVDTIVASKLQFPAKITTPVMQDVDYVEKNLGLSNGSVFNLKDSTYRLMSTTLPIVTLSDLYVYNQRSVLLNQPALYSFESNVIGGAELYDDNIIVLTDDQKITFIKTQKNTFGFITHTDRIVIHAPGVSNSYALGDINKDGKVDLVIGIGTKIFAYTSNGVILDHFPISTVDGGKVIGGPVILNLNTTKEPVIIFGSSNGHLYATDQKGDMISGFPLQTSGIYSSPSFNRNILAVASSDSSIYFWDTGNLFDTTNVYFQWTGYLGGFRHSNNVVSKNASVPAKSSELLPKSFAYNWPNPVYDNKTNIRYFLGKSATVKIKIINMAGELVDELNGTNYVGLDNEVQWDVSKIQSGIYFAQITASGNGGEQSQIIKIAVVK